MSDYVYKTEDVRMYYRNPEGSKIAWQITPAEFDRWLAEVKAQVWEEGYNAKWAETWFEDNPYRQGENK